MKRSRKFLILVAALAVCVGAYFLVQRAETKKSSASSAAEETTTVFSVDPDDVTELTWTYQGKTWTVEKSGGVWIGSDGTALDQSQVSTMVSALGSVASTGTVDASGSLSDYGIDGDSGVTVTVKTDSEEKTLRIGSYSSYAGANYATTDGSTVCLIAGSVSDSLSKDMTSLVQQETLPDLTDLTSFRLVRPDGTLDLCYAAEGDPLYTEGGSHWFLLQDGQDAVPLDDTKVAALTATATGITWSSVAAFHVTDFTAYGSAAETRVELGYKDADGAAQSLTICIGGTAESNAYAWIDGSSIVYRIASTTATTLQSAAADSLKAAS